MKLSHVSIIVSEQFNPDGEFSKSGVEFRKGSSDVTGTIGRNVIWN